MSDDAVHVGENLFVYANLKRRLIDEGKDAGIELKRFTVEIGGILETNRYATETAADISEKRPWCRGENKNDRQSLKVFSYRDDVSGLRENQLMVDPQTRPGR